MQNLKKIVVLTTIWSICAMSNTVYANEQAQTHPRIFGLALEHIKKHTPKKFSSAITHAQNLLGINSEQNEKCVVKSNDKKSKNTANDASISNTENNKEEPSALHAQLTTTINSKKTSEPTEKKYCVIEISSDADAGAVPSRA